MSKTRLYLLGIFTLIVFPIIGVIILFIFEDNLLEYKFQHNWSVLYQSLLGVAVGTISALIAWQIIQLKFLTSARLKYTALIRQFNMNIWDVIFISICAGVGEEILFRGVIQPYLGIYITAVLFVAIHGYLNPKDWKISIYGVYMTFVIIIIGFMTEIAGLLSAIVAHFTIDFVLLLLSIKRRKPYDF